MEIPFHLKTLQPLPGALDIIRYFGQNNIITADADTLCDELGLSDRSFSKAIRRLVTKGYVLMDGDMIYRLSDQGQDASEELAEYDALAGDAPPPPPKQESFPSRTLSRRMVTIIPVSMKASHPTPITIGFHPATESQNNEADLLVRLSVINGEPEKTQDVVFTLNNGGISQIAEVIPGNYEEIRIKMQVYQLGDMGDMDEAGGMYVDIPVTAGEANSTLTAYGTTINIQD